MFANFTFPISFPSAIVTGLYVATALVTVQVVNADYQVRYLVLFSTALGLFTALVQLSWAYMAGRIATQYFPQSHTKFLWLKISSASALICGLILAVLALPAHFDPLWGHHPALTAIRVVFLLSNLVAAWLAAAFLEAAERHAGRQSSTFLNFLLLLYLFVGVWLLRPRVLKLQNQSMT